MTTNKTPPDKIPLFLPHSFMSTEVNKTGSWRYVQPMYVEKTSPCSAACPVGQDVARIEMLITQGKIKEAWKTILKENPFPAVCGRVCFHPCEGACNRGELDEPIAIHTLERFLGDRAGSARMAPDIKLLPANGRNVAIAGSGPAGLGAAYFLSRLGYRCDIFETLPEPGGILRWGIPTYRLPQEVLNNEIKRIENQGVKITCDTPLTAELLQKFKTQYDALFIGCGYGRPIGLKIPGGEMLVDGLEFLYKIRANQKISLEGKAAVFGGGNTAIDVARSAARLGAEAIIVYRRRKLDMPAFEPEVEMALREGVTIRELLAPIRIEKTHTASSDKHPQYVISLQRMKISDTDIEGCARVIPDGDKIEALKVDGVFAAIGAEPGEPWYLPPLENKNQVSFSHCKMMDADIPILYGGDLTNRVKSVSDAIASGKQAAIALDVYFNEGLDAIKKRVADCQVGPGPAVSMAIYLGEERKNRDSHIVSYKEINTDYFEFHIRAIPPNLSSSQSMQSFTEIESTLSENAAMTEAKRCFNCGICNACDFCRLYCPEMSVIVEDTKRRIDLDYCKGCGVCFVECPRSAMALKEE